MTLGIFQLFIYIFPVDRKLNKINECLFEEKTKKKKEYTKMSSFIADFIPYEKKALSLHNSSLINVYCLFKILEKKENKKQKI